MNVKIDFLLKAGVNSILELEDVDDWNEIEDYYVKWGSFFYKHKGVWKEQHINACYQDAIDHKCPAKIRIYELDEDDEVVDDNPIAEKDG